MSNNEKYKKLLIHGAEYLPGGFNSLCDFLNDSEKKGKQLRIKLGIDPTSTDLHVGHTVCLHVLRKFQELGHLPVLLIGGFTATVGDPTGRNEARPPLTYEDVKHNAKTYLDQVHKILDMDKVEVVNNYDWLSKLSSSDMIKLCHYVTVNQLIAKEAFGSRIEKGNPLYLHEIMYPILQGYDSVEIKADIELGGIDQKFNILFGRYLQKQFGQSEQYAMFLPLLIGLDGSRKMSKSFNNYIALNDSPDQIFGKAMSIPDELIDNYLEMVCSYSSEEIADFKMSLASGVNPRDIKMKVASNLVEQYYSKDVAFAAQNGFINQFSKNQIPDEMPEYKINDAIKIIDLMVDSNMTSSKTEAKKLIQGGGVKFKSLKIEDPNYIISKDDMNGVLQIGKRKFLRII